MKIYPFLAFFFFLGNQLFSQSQSPCFYIGNASEYKNMLQSSSNIDLDKTTAEELSFLASTFQVTPTFYYYDEGQTKNAFNSSKSIAGSQSKFGTIGLGLNLIREQISLGGSLTTIPIILAHEFAHTVARKYSLSLSDKQNELFADYLTGVYLYHRNIKFKSTDLNSIFSSFDKMGNNDFNNVANHSSSLNRNKCLKQGYNDCKNNSKQNASSTLEEEVALGVIFIKSQNWD